MKKNPRILILGAGVIGSLYALRFIQSGMNVTVLARGNRLTELKRNGLQYMAKGSVKTVPINLIKTLSDNDIYDFIFVPVRNDQMPSALTAIRDNKSKIIVTLSNSVGYGKWTAIVGDRLIPGFPGAGGELSEGILRAQFGGKVQGTILGEISGERTTRIERIAKIFETANLPYEISTNIRAFHLSHAAFAASIKHFYTPSGIMDTKTAKGGDILGEVASDIKHNICLLKRVGIPILDPKVRVAGKMPVWCIVLMFKIMLSMDFTRSVLLGSHALAAKEEVIQMDKAFRDKLFAL
jgi:2-dehydropantoate 2-reductase